jgi:hypothetical protein
MATKSASKTKAVTKTKVPLTISFDEAVNRYYKLKNDYDNNIKKLVNKIINIDALSSIEKHERFLTEKKKCIICGKSGGTIFQQKGNLLIAKCGNDENPCRLNIQLQRAKYMNIMNDINSQQSRVNNNKASIVDIKLNFLFGFTNQQTTITNFNDMKTQLIESVKLYQNMSEKFFAITENSENKTKISNLTDALQAEIIKLKDLIQNFDETGTIQFLKEAVESYINKISIIVKDLRTLKYKEQYIYMNENDNTQHLIQNTYTPSDLETIIPGTENKIIVFSI